MNRICVFCGSNSGVDSIYKKEAFRLGEKLAENNIELVYGGAKVGLMGAVADGVLSKGGKVIGVIPAFLSLKEVAHENLNEIIVVETMHERKAKMFELSDGVIALPGGFGTLEELFEVLTWAQLNLHQKPIALFNVNGFYDSLLDFIALLCKQGFVKQAHCDMLISTNNINSIIEEMNHYTAPVNDKWFVVN